MIKKDGLLESEESILPQLMKLSGSLPKPDNYHMGQSETTAVLPRNILLFSRDSLSRGHRDESSHNRHVLLFNLETAGTLFIDEQTVQMQAGQAVLIFPYQMHHFIIPSQPINWLFISFELPETYWLDPLRKRICPILPFTEKILYRLIETYSSEGISRQSHSLTHSLGHLLAHLIQVQMGQQPDLRRPPAVLHSQALKVLEKVNRFIYANIGENFCIDTLAAEVGVSASHLRLIVRTEIGMGLGHYISRIRLNHAQRLLQETDQPIKSICFDCGFNSSQSFARAFRRATGVAPHHYRKHGTDASK